MEGERRGAFFYAITPGVVIGLLLAVRLGQWWLFAPLVGGLISYCLFDLAKVWEATKISWLKCVGWHYQPDRERWKIMCLLFPACLLSLVSSCAVLVLIFDLAMRVSDGVSLLSLLQDDKSVRLSIKSNFFAIAEIMIGWFGTLVAIVTSAVISGSAAINKGQVRKNDLTDIYRLIKFGNPLAVFIYWPAVGLRKLVKVLPVLYLLTKVFLVEVLVIINTPGRRLCFTTASLGIVAGYMLNLNVTGILVFGWLTGLAGESDARSNLRKFVLLKLQS